MAHSEDPMWQKPKYHLDVVHSHDHVHRVELFYDLIHVVTIFMLGNYLSHHADLTGFLTFVGLFTALWFAWGELSVFNSLFITTDFKHRIYMCAQIITVMFMAAAIPSVTEKGWVYFVLAFAVNRAITGTLYYRAIRTGSGDQAMERELRVDAQLLLFGGFICHHGVFARPFAVLGFWGWRGFNAVVLYAAENRLFAP